MNGRRTHVEPRIELPWRRPYGFARLTSGFRYTQYDLVDEPAGLDDHPSRDLWFGVADGGLIFERQSSYFGDSAVHTLEPRLYYLAQQREDQSELPRFDTGELTFGYSQLFRDNRFAGLDRIGDANQLSAGFTTRFLGESTGREYLRASLGQIFYFEDREVTLTDIETSDERHSTSAFAGESGFLLGERWSGGSNVVWDPHENDWSEVGAYLRYRGPARDVFSVGFRRLYDYGVELRQIDASFYFPWLRRLALLGRAYYDFEVNTEMDVFGGVEYNDCCWRLRLVGRRFLQVPSSGRIEDGEMESGVFLQIVFKGLAGFGGKIDRMIEKGIVGFQPEDI
jgi:LPS-assembly protein